MPCNVCEELTTVHPVRDRQGALTGHDPDVSRLRLAAIEDLRRASASGCMLCNLIFRGICAFEPTKRQIVEVTATSSTDRSDGSPTYGQRNTLYVEVTHEVGPALNLDIYAGDST